MANQPPGPGVALPQVFMLPMMALLTALGGGYAILHAETKSRGEKVTKWISIVVLFLFGFTHEGASTMVTCLFGAAVVYRGVRMISWGMHFKASPGKPRPMVPSWRLIPAGLLMILAAFYLIGSALVFVSYWPDAYEGMQVAALKKVLASEIAYGRTQKQRTGEVRFYRIKAGDDSDRYAEELLHHGNVRVDFSPDAKHFSVYILPYSKFPPWPYRSWTKQGSYRADESGTIRMVWVQQQGEVCPADAPIVMKVAEDDIREAIEGAKPPN
jgi:hypothetical protein